jgi:transposase
MKTQHNYNNKSKDELLSIIANQAKQIQLLEEMHLAYRSRLFANKSETLNHIQQSLFDEAQLPKDPEKILAAEEEIQVAPYTRKKSVGRKALPEELTRIPRIYDLSENEKICSCGSELTHIKDEKSEQLEIIPAKIYVIQHIRKKYACKQCEETIKTAKKPLLPIPRSIAASGLLSLVSTRTNFKTHRHRYSTRHVKFMGDQMRRTIVAINETIARYHFGL